MVGDQGNASEGMSKMPLPFVETLTIDLDTDEELFSWFFGGDEYKQWRRDESSWQLRCTGSPGSGKVSRDQSHSIPFLS
jgi:hypothetical protein